MPLPTVEGTVFPTQVVTSSEHAVDSCTQTVCFVTPQATAIEVMDTSSTFFTPAPPNPTSMSSFTAAPPSVTTGILVSPTPVDLGSGSGMDDSLEPFPSPTLGATPPSTFVVITLSLPLEEFRLEQESNFTATVETILSSVTGELVIQVDNEQSVGGQTVVVIYIEDENGIPDDVSTEEVYRVLGSSSNAQWLEYIAQFVS